jgi:hypothetical protein
MDMNTIWQMVCHIRIWRALDERLRTSTNCENSTYSAKVSLCKMTWFSKENVKYFGIQQRIYVGRALPGFSASVLWVSLCMKQ